MFPDATSQNVKLQLFEILDMYFKDIVIWFLYGSFKVHIWNAWSRKVSIIS